MINYFFWRLFSNIHLRGTISHEALRYVIVLILARCECLLLLANITITLNLAECAGECRSGSVSSRLSYCCTLNSGNFARCSLYTLYPALWLGKILLNCFILCCLRNIIVVLPLVLLCSNLVNKATLYVVHHNIFKTRTRIKTTSYYSFTLLKYFI